MTKKPLVAHTLLFAAYPAIFLLAGNIERLWISELLVPLGIILLVATASLAVLYLPLRSIHKAAAFASPAWLLFWYYSSIYEHIEGFTLWSIKLGRQRFLLLGIGLLVGLLLFALLRTRKRLHNLTRILNVVSGCLVCLAVGQILTYEVTHLSEGKPRATSIQSTTRADATGTSPDIYYVILDGYGREDILRELYGHDNSTFLQALRDRGFYVADQAHSNYCQTHLSLGSSLNLDYLDALPVSLDPKSDNRRLLSPLIKNSRLLRYLRAKGYTFVSFASGFAPTELRNADIYVTSGWSLSAYQTSLLSSTPLALWMNGFVEWRFQEHRNRVRRALGQLSDTEIHPKFVFAHIISPHPPFVFGPHGEELRPWNRYVIFDGSHLLERTKMSPEQYEQSYADQLTYLNTLVLQSVDKILATSPSPPIIILQGDHGPGSHLDWNSAEKTDTRERLSILNVYYFPDGDYSRLYPEITPVNSFRVVLSQYFGESFEPLEDRSYFCCWGTPFQFIDVTQEVR